MRQTVAGEAAKATTTNRAVARTNRMPKTRRRMQRVNIAPGISLTTVPGSMYSTLAKALATVGCLDRHDSLFNAFVRNSNADSARRLLDTIGTSRTELDTLVRASQELGRGAEGFTTETDRRKQPFERGTDGEIVIYDEDRGLAIVVTRHKHK